MYRQKRESEYEKKDNIHKKEKSTSFVNFSFMVPRTGLEPARLSARAPETRASTIPPPGHG